MNIPTQLPSKATLSGNGHTADCAVMINKLNAVTTMNIYDFPPTLPDGEYTLTVPGEPSSQWRLTKRHWERL
jgi:hypothetical protein